MKEAILKKLECQTIFNSVEQLQRDARFFHLVNLRLLYRRFSLAKISHSSPTVPFFSPLFKLVDSHLVKFLARNAVRLWNDSKSLLVLFERRTVWYYSYLFCFAPVHLTQTGLLVKLTAINYQQFCQRLVALYSSFAFLVFPSASIRESLLRIFCSIFYLNINVCTLTSTSIETPSNICKYIKYILNEIRFSNFDLWSHHHR